MPGRFVHVRNSQPPLPTIACIFLAWAVGSTRRPSYGLSPKQGTRTEQYIAGGGDIVNPLLGPQSRFGDKLLTIRVLCPHIWECGAKRVNGTKTHQLEK